MQTPPSRGTIIEAAVASTVGTTIEWYDFFLYGLVAPLVFPKVFFPEADPFTGTILAFGTYSVGFVARPLGGVVFGYMGDRVGRKSMLVTTLLMMGVSTLVIGFLPGYAAIGPAAWTSLHGRIVSCWSMPRSTGRGNCRRSARCPRLVPC